MLQVSHLSVAYGARKIIPDLSLTPLRPGTVTALLGPNGSGKSTLLKALAGLLPVTAGEVVLDGKSIALTRKLRTRPEHVVYLPQSLPAAVHLRVYESVLAAAKASYISGHADATEMAVVHALLEKVGIAHLAMRFLDELSGGQKQLVGLAQALIRQPRLLLLDEPLSALDLNYQFHVMDLLRRQSIEHELITVIVLHDINIALRHADEALLLRQGVLLAQGRPAEIITPDALASVYGVDARVEHCSRGVAQVMIDGLHQSLS